MNSERIRSSYDQHARDGFPWKKRNKTYHANLRQLIAFLAPPCQSVLEIGCGNGDLLNFLRIEDAVGIDFSPVTIEKARELYPHIEFHHMDATRITLERRFDLIILSDLVGELDDVYLVFEQLKKLCGPQTRIIITYFSYLWVPFLKIAEKIGWKIPQNYQNWLSLTDLSNFLTLAGSEVIKKGWHILMPIHIPFFSAFVNTVLAPLPVLRRLCLTQYIVARPKPDLFPQKAEHISCSVVIPTRNEKGNVRAAVERIPAMGSHTEILFIDGCSTDGTVEEIEAVISENEGRKDIKLLHQVSRDHVNTAEKQSGRMLKLGKGDAVRKAFQQANGDVLMILDADLTVPPEELPKFFNLAVNRVGELIMGTRLVYPMERQAMRFLNILGNKFFSLLFSWILEQPIKDTLCGTKVLFRSAYRQIEAGRSFFGDFDPFGDFDLIFGAAKLNLKIVELPIHYRQRLYGDIKIQRFRHGLILLRMSLLAFKKFRVLAYAKK
ncbi:glycosyltransferase [bacterium]|nr:glycosyltransferase [bacterium]